MRTSNICPTCSTFSNALCTLYNGVPLTTLGILELDDLETALTKIDTYLTPVGYTVGTLPAGTIGQKAYVTDATAPTYLGTLTGGGTVVCPVFYNGVAWVSA